MVIVIPIFLKTIISLGYDPVWFGVIVTIQSEIAAITPPVGFNLFVLKSVVPGVNLNDVANGAMIFVIPMLVAIVILTVFPEIALFLPRMLLSTNKARHRHDRSQSREPGIAHGREEERDRREGAQGRAHRSGLGPAARLSARICGRPWRGRRPAAVPSRAGAGTPADRARASRLQRSSEFRQGNRVEDFLFHYCEVFDALKLDRFALVGHCVGGWLAAEYAVRHPERVTRLALIGASGLFVPGEQIGDIFMNSKPDHGTSLASLRHMLFAGKDAPQALRYYPDGRGDIDEEMRRYAMLRFGSAIGFRPPYLYNWPLVDRLYRATMPSSSIWGAEDHMVPVAHGRDLCGAARQRLAVEADRRRRPRRASGKAGRGAGACEPVLAA